ncbi:Protein of unknown function [Pyronema omphalodes CBS 100304]|uniref:Uncharacterized protein n=1 Tax=Pyronema omphalodes (strain CBS 100304) TaxID=1076935 RepID=U4L482_PYROM|nr:Protein of unknown function [Pyronema omphalodes CBS 100304]
MAAVSVGDIIAAAKFFHSVYENIKDADVEFNNFKLAAGQLGDVLEELFKALEEQQRIIHNRGASTRLKGPHKDDLKTLRDILGDFQLLQNQTEVFLEKHRSERSLLRRTFHQATGGMAKELRELRSAMLLHMQRVQFACQTLQIKAQSGISQRQEEMNHELMQQFKEQMERFYGIPTALSRSNTKRLGKNGGQMVLASRKTPAQEVVDEFAWLDEHFAINLPAEYSTNMPKMVDGKGLTTTDESDEDFYQRYIDLSKSYWLLRQVTTMQEFKQLQTYSMWSQYIANLSEKITGEFNMLKGSARIPSLDELKEFALQKQKCFDMGFGNSWSHFRTPNGGEVDDGIEILRLTLPAYPVGERDRKVTVYQHDTQHTNDLTLEDEYVAKADSFIHASRRMAANQRQTTSVTRTEAQLIPCYAWGTQQNGAGQNQSHTLMLKPEKDRKPIGFEFNNNSDMFAFQKTFTGFGVKADIPRVDKITLKTGFFSERQYTRARLQIWMEDIRDQPTTPHLNGGPSQCTSPLNPPVEDRGSLAPSSAFTGMSRGSALSHTSTILPAQRIQTIESCQLVIYTNDKLQQIFFISLDHCKIDNDACCGRSKRSNGVQTECCDRVVLVAPTKYLGIHRLTQSGNQQLAIPIAEEFLKHDRMKSDAPRPVGKQKQVRWVAVKFKSIQDKGLFVRKFMEMERVRSVKIDIQYRTLQQAKFMEVM